jgi:hypothetical protein
MNDKRLYAGTLWRHVKSGRIYRIEKWVMIEREMVTAIEYSPYPGTPFGLNWVRPLSEWEEEVTDEKGTHPRFVPHVDDAPTRDAGWLEKSNTEALEWGERHVERRRQDMRDGLFPNVEGLSQ